MPYDDEIAALNWPVGVDVTLEIDDPGNGTGVDYEQTLTAGPAAFDQHVSLAAFQLDGTFDVQPGQQITISDGVTEKTHIVTNLAVTDVDIAADTVSGTAEPGSNVQIEVWRAPLWWYATRGEVVDGSGNWSADFSTLDDEEHQGALPHDITEMTYGVALEVEDDPFNMPYRDATLDFWPFDGGNDAHTPQIVATPTEDRIEGRSWPFGAEVTLTISTPGLAFVYTDTATVEEVHIDPGQTYVEFPLYDIFDVLAGQVVTLTDGVTAKSLTVTPATITAIDPAADTIAGTATPGTDINVDIAVPAVGGVGGRHEVADGSGDWTTDFSTAGDEGGEDQVTDIAYGQNMQAHIAQHDDDGDVTVTQILVAPVPGDVNCDGGVNSVDALFVLRFTVGLTVDLSPGCPMIGTY
jgi:hypothetical protein